jgi:hypothetical protein
MMLFLIDLVIILLLKVIEVMEGMMRIIVMCLLNWVVQLLDVFLCSWPKLGIMILIRKDGL